LVQFFAPHGSIYRYAAYSLYTFRQEVLLLTDSAHDKNVGNIDIAYESYRRYYWYQPILQY